MKYKFFLLLLASFTGTNLIFCQQSFLTEDGIAVFCPPGFDSTRTLPSFAIIKSLIPRHRIPAKWKLIPEFITQNNKSIVKITYDGKVDLYGNGEVIGPLKRNNTETVLWNTDNYEYSKANGKSLYQSHPWVMGVREDGSSFGIITDNTWKQTFSLKNPVTITSDGPPFRVIIIEKKTPQELLQALADLTGKINLPPLWALGYQQCKFSYYPQSRVKEIATEFRKRDIPCDVIWMDIDYMQNYKIFTFDSLSFPDPAGLNNYLHSINFKSVWMIDPGVKDEIGYFVFDQGSAYDLWVKNKENKDYKGNVWPGECVFPDFTIPKTREWWSGLYKKYMATGIDGIWNDMNEPSVFNGPGGTMPEDNIHRGGGNLPQDIHARYHNVYGMLMVKASLDGIINARPDKRPFILSRASFLGGQKYAATWTGDNTTSWEHFKMATPMILNLGLSGQPFCGPDIGGYSGRPDSDLFANWISVGAFYPFCRNHSAKRESDQEPWAFGKKIEDISRVALERRYRLLPYLYTLFREASMTGLPVMRPVFFDDISDTTLRHEQEAFTWGKDLLIIPKWSDKPDLPKGIWRPVYLIDKNSENDKYQPTLKQKGGSIIPIGSVIQSTAEYKTDSITLLVCLDKNYKAGGILYIDSGEGFDYRNNDYETVIFKAGKVGKNTFSVKCKDHGKNQSGKQRCYKIGIVTDSGIYYSDWQKKNCIKIVLNHGD